MKFIESFLAKAAAAAALSVSEARGAASAAIQVAAAAGNTAQAADNRAAHAAMLAVEAVAKAMSAAASADAVTPQLYTRACTQREYTMLHVNTQHSGLPRVIRLYRSRY